MIEHFVNNGILTAGEAQRARDLMLSQKLSAEQAILLLGLIQEEKIIDYCRKIIGR